MRLAERIARRYATAQRVLTRYAKAEEDALWRRWLDEVYDGGKRKVPNPNPETRKRYREVSFSTALRDPAVKERAKKEFAAWLGKQKAEPESTHEDKAEAPKSTRSAPVFKSDPESVDRLLKEHKAVFDKIQASVEAQVKSFKPSPPPEHRSYQKDLMAEHWNRMSHAEKVIHVGGHLVGEYYEKHVLKTEADRDLHEKYLGKWQTTAGSYDSEGYGHREDYVHTSQEMQGLAAASGFEGHPAPEDLKADRDCKGDVTKARQNATKDAKLVAHMKRMYDFQQAFFKHLGLTEMTVFRGVKGQGITDEGAPEVGAAVQVKTRELSSFTGDINLAQHFGRALEYKVPVERIFASSLVYPMFGSETTDRGMKEAEFIVMGSSSLTGKVASPLYAEDKELFDERKDYESKLASKALVLPITDENENWLRKR